MDERLPNKPAIEFNKIKAAAVPDAALTDVHPNNTMSGERKIQPPVPVNPEMKPMLAPAIKAYKRFTFFNCVGAF